ncbi:hypothetical protein BDC45DRAFT_477841 [Circinella umbellata]|nr:hypothetical protein BDC45DRAFT_477841 [Circinella umbellata]
MITNSQAQYPILYWLKWLKDEHGYIPSRVMIDAFDTEIIAITKVYNYVHDDPSTNIFIDKVKILICHWHVFRAWKKNILTKLIVKTSNLPKNFEGKESHARPCAISNDEYDES